MIILLTGEPQAGKSTVVQKFIKHFQGDCQWVYMRTVADGPDPRAGFEVVSSDGRHHLIAHKTAIKSDIVVGHNQFHVDTGIIDEFYTRPLEQALANPPDCFVLDEIGNMQRLSPNFTPAVDQAFDRNLNMLATIRTRDEWTLDYRHHHNAICLAVTPHTRDQLPDLLTRIFSSLLLLQRLIPAQQRAVNGLMGEYAEHGRLLQLEKLCDAVRHVAANHVTVTGTDQFAVHGDHGDYQAQLKPKPSCVCDLFLGRGKFAGRAGDCSHIMAARLFSLAATTG